jgi:hypothetical protein
MGRKYKKEAKRMRKGNRPVRYRFPYVGTTVDKPSQTGSPTPNCEALKIDPFKLGEKKEQELNQVEVLIVEEPGHVVSHVNQEKDQTYTRSTAELLTTEPNHASENVARTADLLQIIDMVNSKQATLKSDVISDEEFKMRYPSEHAQMIAFQEANPGDLESLQKYAKFLTKGLD